VAARNEGEEAGNECEIHLPTAGIGGGLERPRPDQEKAAARPRRILVVDDAPDGADTLAALLELLDHQVATAYSGRQAIAVAAEFLPEVVFLDIGLPDMSGYDVARALRQLEGLSNVYLVALTAYSREEDRRRAFDAGFNDHMAKPIEFERIVATIFAPGHHASP
jgi:CheY-like chemotaxis protein